MSTKLKIQKVRAEIEAHEGRGWLKGYEEGLAKREEEVVTLQDALEARNERTRELSHQKNGPKTAREALERAWELAHPVREGQVIPKDIRYLARHSEPIQEFIATDDIEIVSWLVGAVRTFDPLPDPKPDWHDAPAVLARVEDEEPHVWVNVGERGWRDQGGGTMSWSALRDVTPLYPREGTDA